MFEFPSPSATYNPLLVDLKECAKIVSLSVPTLRKLIKDGMPIIQPGRKILVDPQEAVQWLKQSRPEPRKRDDLNAWLDEIVRDMD
jgi:excisionase family DNA binding protein